MSVSIRDIARELNIDPSTVSSCLSADPGARRISAARVEEVRRKAEEMGYIPNRLAGRIFRRNRRKNLALIFKNDTAGERTLPVLDYAIRTLGERNACDFTVLYAGNNALAQAVREGIGLGVTDFIVIGYMRGRDFADLARHRLPPVRIYAPDYYADAGDKPCSYAAARLGFDRGKFYRDLTLFLEKQHLGPVLTVRAVEPGQRLPAGKDLLGYAVGSTGDLFDYGARELAPRIEEKWQQGLCRTVLLRNDSLAVGVMDALLERGIRIPEDLAVISFNNAPFARYARIPLTSVGLPLQENLDRIFRHLLDDEVLAPVTRCSPEIFWRCSTPPGLAGAWQQEMEKKKRSTDDAGFDH